MPNRTWIFATTKEPKTSLRVASGKAVRIDDLRVLKYSPTMDK